VLLVSGVAIGSAGSAGALPPLPPLPAPVAGLPATLPTEAAALAGLGALPAAAPPAAGPLIDELVVLAELTGTPLDRTATAAQIDRAGLTAGTDAALATLLAATAACAADTDALLARTPHAELLAADAAPDPADVAALRACAVSLRATLEALRPALAADGAEEPIRVWPLLAFSPGDSDDVYVEDYALTVDQGGDDTYLNNQGSNMLDLKRSVTNEAALRYGEPARGCRMTYPDSVSGRILEEPGPNGERQLSFDGPECVPVAGLLWDMAGADTYGRLEDPVFPDTQCSLDPSVLRFTTIGAGVEGVGMLVDDGGDDTYLGKTGTMGSGHLGGVGLLEDRAGDDSYLAIRNAQGLGLLGGLGVLRDDTGDDVYDYYMPGPIDPAAPFHADGSGGVVDDSGLFSEIMRSPNEADGVGGRCDNKPRSLQGVGIFLAPSIGVLVDHEGADSYRAAGYENQDEGFPTQTGTGLIRFAHGSQGSGFLGGFGAMFDLGGHDEYLREDREPAPDRRNGQVKLPEVDPSLDEEGTPENGKPLDLSIFVDNG